MEQTMTAKETARMASWLKAKGLSSDEILDLIHFIATGINAPDSEGDDDDE